MTFATVPIAPATFPRDVGSGSHSRQIELNTFDQDNLVLEFLQFGHCIRRSDELP